MNRPRIKRFKSLLTFVPVMAAGYGEIWRDFRKHTGWVLKMIRITWTGNA